MLPGPQDASQVTGSGTGLQIVVCLLLIPASASNEVRRRLIEANAPVRLSRRKVNE